MTDIVEQLRDGFYGAETSPLLSSEAKLMLEAADEIERLRMENKRLSVANENIWKAAQAFVETLKHWRPAD
jgi:hypothetical protein